MGAPTNIRKTDVTTGKNRVSLAVAENDGSIQDLDEYNGVQIEDGSTLEMYTEDWLEVIAVYRYTNGENWALITKDEDEMNAPTYVSSTVNETGDILTITFSKPMADPAGEQASFAVEDGDSVTITSISLNEDRTKFDLVLARAAHHDDNVTVAYTKGNIKSSDVVYLATFAAQISNNPVPAPEFVSAITTFGGTMVIVTFDKEMADPVGKHAQFTVNDGAANAVTEIALGGDGMTFELTLTNVLEDTDTVTVAYTEGTIVDASGSILHTFAAQEVTNSVGVGEPL